ncbi:hypothetical protein GDO81_021893 [Engystomops pustulosus]|uniref:Uncharacterized protein n=1 Tax=Engystomops pustulosus TaxID=76066 RepID=A0AAV6ZRH8_ENGPU|nr:hypothetical protein GDO81_021893 [Engystomops pustulosus]
MNYATQRYAPPHMKHPLSCPRHTLVGETGTSHHYGPQHCGIREQHGGAICQNLDPLVVPATYLMAQFRPQHKLTNTGGTHPPPILAARPVLPSAHGAHRAHPQHGQQPHHHRHMCQWQPQIF